MLRTLRTTFVSAAALQPVKSSVADLHSDEIDRLRDQLWIGLMVATTRGTSARALVAQHAATMATGSDSFILTPLATAIHGGDML